MLYNDAKIQNTKIQKHVKMKKKSVHLAVTMGSSVTWVDTPSVQQAFQEQIAYPEMHFPTSKSMTRKDKCFLVA